MLSINEAIEVLRHLQDSDYPKYSEALEMAIKNLEAWEKVRAEIDEKSNIAFSKSRYGESAGLNTAINIIDKHLKEVSE